MYIHLVTDRFHLGGGLEHIYQLVKGFPDIRFRVFARGGDREAVDKFHPLENVEINDGGYEPSVVLAQKPDLVHIHHLKPLFSFFKNPFRSYSVPVVYTAHGLHIHKFEFYRSFSGKTNYFLRFHLEKRLLPRADTVIAVSKEDRIFLESKFHLSNVTYLTNGIDFSSVTSDTRQGQPGAEENKVELRRRLGLPRDDFLFITVARFNFQKGYDILIRAIALVRDALRGRNVRFVFVGDGDEFKTMNDLSRELSVFGYIRFLGARTDVYDILRCGDVFLLPSRWEGLPIVLLETGLLKLPAIVSDTYGNREIIRETNGILFKNLDEIALGKVIVNVLDGRYDLRGLSESLYREVKLNYGLERMLTGLRNIYGTAKKKPL